MSKLSFADLAIIYKTTQKVQGSQNGVITILDEQILQVLKKAISDENYEESGVEIDVDTPDQLALGQTYSIKIGSPRFGLGMVVQDIDELLNSPLARMSEPKNYFILDDNFEKNDLIIPDGIVRYRKTLSFLAVLKSCAAYTDVAASELVFLHDGKFVIPVKYSKALIDQTDFTIIDKLLRFFENDTHEEQKIAILSNTILSILQISARNKRFATLLTEIATVLIKFNDGYKLFIADFSYDKIREQFEADKIEYSNRIHKVFSDIQSQLLSIPVATVIVATQMKVVKDGSGDLANRALLAGSWIFAVIFFLLCYNQWKTISGIKDEITKKEKKISSDYEGVDEIFEKIFDVLHRRIRQQYTFLVIVVFVLVTALISTHIFYFKIQDKNSESQTEIKNAKP